MDLSVSQTELDAPRPFATNGTSSTFPTKVTRRSTRAHVPKGVVSDDASAYRAMLAVEDCHSILGERVGDEKVLVGITGHGEDKKVRFSTIWEEGQLRLQKVNHLLGRAQDVLDLPDDAQDLAQLSQLPPEFLDLEYNHMTAGLEQLKATKTARSDGEELDGFIRVKPLLSESAPKPDTVTQLRFVPKREKNPVAEVHQYTQNKEKWGAIFELGATSLASQQRRQRWRPTFRALEDAEKTLTALEAFSRRAIEADAVEHPAKLSKTERDDVLNEGLGQENDELSTFIKRWLDDINHRLGIILTYEQTKRNNKLHSMNHHGTQTMRIPADGHGTPAATPAVTALHQMSEASNTDFLKDSRHESDPYSLFKQDLSVRHHQGKFKIGHSLIGSTGTSNYGFQHAVSKTSAAMRIQAVYRGYYTRTVTGNFLTHQRTLFSATDRRIAQLWCERVVRPQLEALSTTNALQPTVNESPLWLMSLAANLFAGKLASDYMSLYSLLTSQRERVLSTGPLSLDELNLKTFVEYLFHTLPESFPGDNIELSATRFLVTVTDLRHQDPIFSLLHFLLLGDFTPWQEVVLSKVCHRIGEIQTKSVNLSPQFVALELDTESWMNPSAIHNLVKSLMPKNPGEIHHIMPRIWAVAKHLFIDPSSSESPIQVTKLKKLYIPLEDDCPELKLTHKQLMLVLPIALYDDFVTSRCRDPLRLILPPNAFVLGELEGPE